MLCSSFSKAALCILREWDMPQALPMFLGVYLHLDLKHQTNESTYWPFSLRARAEMTQECLFGSGFPYVALCSFSPTFAVAPLENRWRTEHWWTRGSKEEHWKQERFAARGISFLWLFVQCRIMTPFVLARVVVADGLAMEHTNHSCWHVGSGFAAMPRATANSQPQRDAGWDSAQLFWRKETIEKFREVGN